MTDQSNSNNWVPPQNDQDDQVSAVPTAPAQPTQQGQPPVSAPTVNGNFIVPVNTVQWITYTITGCSGVSGNWMLQEVVPAKVDKKPKEDGCACKKCKNFFPMAVANQEDGTLICYSCRQGW